MEMNPYPEDYARASECLRLALSLMAQHKIPPSPLNYRLGYDHVAGNNEALKTALDELMVESGAADESSLWELYRRFFIQDDKALETMRQEIQHIIANLQGEFERSGGNLSGYAKTLNRFANVLDTSPPDELTAEVNKVIDDTRSMGRSHQRLEQQMSGIMNEVESLRKELEQVKEESLTDALTGISNRKAFDTALEHRIHLAGEMEGAPFCLLLADIDHFKKFNDAHGHLVGDKVLRFVASTLKRCVKGSDMAARFGGEEFAVILPQTALIGAEVVAEQIRNAVSAGELKDKSNGRSYGRITISIGVAQFNPDDFPKDLVERADRALYLAKDAGRNRVAKVA